MRLANVSYWLGFSLLYSARLLAAARVSSSQTIEEAIFMNNQIEPDT